jgi:putative transposase
LSEVATKENGFEEVLKLSLEALMRAEREEYKKENTDMSNGYRPRKSVGRGKMLELQVPRTRHGNFYPLILGLLRNQEEEARQIAFKLYGAGLTTSQVGELFGDIYGKKYSTSQVSRIFDFARDEVKQWLRCPLEPYYPILMIDATFIYTRRVDCVSKEGYYTILGVKEDRPGRFWPL